MVNIPSSVNTLQEYSFAGCTALEAIILEGTTPPSIGANAFNGLNSGCTFYVPAGSLETYENATGWSSFVGRIEEVL